MQSVAGDYLQRSIDLFASQQKQLQEQLKSAVSGHNPITAMAEMTETNLETWKKMQESFFKSALNVPFGKRGDEDKEA